MNKRIAIALFSTIWLLAGTMVAGAQTHPNFSGQWQLDAKRTRELPAQFKSYHMTVKQEENQISIESHVDGPLFSAPEPVASGPGQPMNPSAGQSASSGGGTGLSRGNPMSGESAEGSSNQVAIAKGRALATPIRRFHSTLDGQPKVTEPNSLVPGRITREAHWRRGDKTLELNVQREYEGEGKKLSATLRETWDLIDNGAVLRIKRTVNLPAGWDEATLFFVKQ